MEKQAMTSHPFASSCKWILRCFKFCFCHLVRSICQFSNETPFFSKALLSHQGPITFCHIISPFVCYWLFPYIRPSFYQLSTLIGKQTKPGKKTPELQANAFFFNPLTDQTNFMTIIKSKWSGGHHSLNRVNVLSPLVKFSLCVLIFLDLNHWP